MPSGQVVVDQGSLNVWDRSSDKTPVPVGGIMRRQAPNQRAGGGTNRGSLNHFVQPGRLDFGRNGFAGRLSQGLAEDEILCLVKLPRFVNFPSVQPTRGLTFPSAVIFSP